MGVLLLIVGSVCFMLKNVELFAWAEGPVVPSFAAGVSGLGIWYLSGRKYENRKTNTSGNSSELVSDLAQLKELHAAGALTDEEFKDVKQRLLKPAK
jgi:hypothetical protein